MGRRSAPVISLVVPTYGRTWQLTRLFRSLEAQTCRDFEVIISDQNPEGYLGEVVAQGAWSFPIRHICRPNDRGISTARNVGWRHASAPVVCFPDDDAWYPADFLERGLVRMAALNADILSGRSTDETGRSINGRFAADLRAITVGGVWIMQIEWMTFFRRDLLERLDGYDETLGIGAATPWQAAEGPDLILRALAKGARCYYDPDFLGHHDEYETHPPSDQMTAKAQAYARGMGFVLRKNGAGLATAVYWALRPLYQLAMALLRFEFRRVRFFFLVSIGRLEGWTGWLLPIRPLVRPFAVSVEDGGEAAKSS